MRFIIPRANSETQTYVTNRLPHQIRHYNTYRVIGHGFLPFFLEGRICLLIEFLHCSDYQVSPYLFSSRRWDFLRKKRDFPVVWALASWRPAEIPKTKASTPTSIYGGTTLLGATRSMVSLSSPAPRAPPLPKLTVLRGRANTTLTMQTTSSGFFH